MDVFKVLGNQNRRRILGLLMYKDLHISALAKELGISVPVALKHVLILEDAGFVTRAKVGSTHIVSINSEAAQKVKSAFGLFDEPLVVQVPKGTSLLAALRKAVRLRVEKTPGGVFISSVEGKQGYYIYEVNGRFTEKPVDQFLVNEKLEVEFKRLVPVVGRKIVVKPGHYPV